MRLHLASFVEDFRRRAAETAAVTHRGVRRYRTSYGELATMAGRFAAELRRREIGAGERVLLWGENSVEWMAAFFGCLLCGVLVVPLDAAGSAAFAARIADEVSPRLVVADPKRLAMLRAEVPALSLSGLGEEIPAEADFRVDGAVREDAPFQIIFTSGTTSEPKGIVHTHRNVLASLRPIEAEVERYGRYRWLAHPLRILLTLPLSHVFGQFMGLWIPVVLVAELHLTDRVEAGRLIEIVRRERISVLVAVPRILALLRARLLATVPGLAEEIGHAEDLSLAGRWWRFRLVHRELGWKFWAVISGGAALPAELESFWNRMGFALIQGYGMTETAALVTLNHPLRIGQGTIGKTLPGREVCLSEAGEMLVRGEVVATATWKDGRLAQRTDEWLHTGDLAEQTGSGEFRFLGRVADAIVTGSGTNIHPADLEAAMLRQPGVEACAVVPCDGLWGPEPVCVVRFAGDDAQMGSAVRGANRELAEFQQIRRVLRWPGMTLPYTATGKLLRRDVREWACRAMGASATAVTTPSAEDSLLAAITSITGERVAAEIGAEGTRLSEDLHLDSLGRVQLAAAIEQRTGVGIEDEQMASVETLGELRRLASWGAAGSRADAHAEELKARVLAPGEARTAMSNARRDSDDEVVAAPYPRWTWWAPVRVLRFVFQEIVVRPLVKVLLAPRVTGPRVLLQGPMLIVANHVTALDGALVVSALPGSMRRRTAIMMGGEMLAEYRSGELYGMLGRAAYWLMTALFNVFPLPQRRGFRRSFAHAGEALDRGSSVVIFPEGKRSRTGELAPFRPGIGLLSVEAEVPVLPVALLGLEEIRKPGARWFRSGRLTVRVGEPIRWEPGRSAAAWTTEIEGELRKLGAGSGAIEQVSSLRAHVPSVR